MAAKIIGRVAPGIYELESGAFRVKVGVGDRRRTRPREKQFPRGTSLRAMKAWQTQERAVLLRRGIVAARGTLAADIPRYLERVKPTLEHPKDREHEIRAWIPQFGQRARHTISRDEITSQVRKWHGEGVAASTIRHRMTALSGLYRELDGEDAPNPVKGVKRPVEPPPTPGERPVHIIQAVLDELWFRAAMNNRGWKTLARTLVLTHTGIRPAQLKKLEAVS
jgi:hypothetical protein